MDQWRCVYNLSCCLVALVPLNPVKYVSSARYRAEINFLAMSDHGAVMDTENQLLPNDRSGKDGFVRAWKVPLPLRRNHVLSDMLTVALCLAVLAYSSMLPFLLLLLTCLDAGASASLFGYKSSTRAPIALPTTTSTIFSTDTPREKALLSGTMHTRLSSTMLIQCQYTLTTTILVAYRFSRHWLRAVLVWKLMYTSSEALY